MRDLETFRVKVTAAANETFGAWREGQHDDLVLAVGIAAWQAERQAPFFFQIIPGPEVEPPRWWRPSVLLR